MVLPSGGAVPVYDLMEENEFRLILANWRKVKKDRGWVNFPSTRRDRWRHLKSEADRRSRKHGLFLIYDHAYAG